MDTAPSTMMNSAMTHAKMGRSMKNLAMRLGCQEDLAAEAPERGAEAPAAGAWPPLGAEAVPAGRRAGSGGLAAVPGHGLHRRAGRQHLQLHHAVDHDLLAGLQAVDHDPLAVLRAADLDRPRLHLAAGADHQHAVALAGARDGLLRQQDDVAGLGLLDPHAHVHARQQHALGVGHFGTQRHLAAGGIDLQVGEQHAGRLRILAAVLEDAP